jgi:hypothetical protein
MMNPSDEVLRSEREQVDRALRASAGAPSCVIDALVTARGMLTAVKAQAISAEVAGAIRARAAHSLRLWRIWTVRWGRRTESL